MFEKIKIIFMDVDGVLTRGEVYTGGEESPRIMHVRDRLAIKAIKEKFSGNIYLYWITGRSSEHLKVAAKELLVDGVYDGVDRKLELVKKILCSLSLTAAEAMYIGDDLIDLACIKFCGVSCAPADAAVEVKEAADYITSSRGGEGAVREVIENILKERGAWEEVVEKFEKNA